MTQSNTPRKEHSVSKLVLENRWSIPFALVLTYATVFSLWQPKVFLHPYNLKSLLLEFSIPTFVAIGMAFQLIDGEIDLSMANNVMFTNIFCGVMIMRGFPVYTAIAITLITSLIFGTLVGLVVSRLKINSFIASLGFGQIYYSLGLALYSYGSDAKHFVIPGVDLLHMSAEFKRIGQTELWGLQLPVYYALVVILFSILFLPRTKFFRKHYYIGANAEAARLSGIRVESMKTGSFIISSFIFA